MGCTIKSHVWWNMKIQLFLHYHTLQQIWIVKSNKITWNQNNKYMKWKSTLTIYNKITKLDWWPFLMPTWNLLDHQMLNSKRDKITEFNLALISQVGLQKESFHESILHHNNSRKNQSYIIIILPNLHNNNSLPPLMKRGHSLLYMRSLKIR